jgi:hypothetical protein
MASLHNVGVERGEALTILSLLPRREAPADAGIGGGERTLDDAVQRLQEIGGEDAQAHHVVSVHKAVDGVRHFLTEDHVPLRELVRRWYLQADDDGRAVTILSLLQPTADHEHALADPVPADGAHGFFDNLVEFFLGLFRLGGERHGSITVERVLEPPSAAPDNDDDEGPVRAALEHLYHAAADREAPLTVIAVLGPIPPAD